MIRNIILNSIVMFLFSVACQSDHNNRNLGETTRNNTQVQTEIKLTANRTITSWLNDGIEGVQFLHTSDWQIDDRIFLNSSCDKGYLLLLNRDLSPLAELDYIQVLYTAKEEGVWNIYLESMPNIIIPRTKVNGNFKPSTFEQLALAGEQVMERNYRKSDGTINDSFVNNEFNTDLKKNHLIFLSKRLESKLKSIRCSSFS